MRVIVTCVPQTGHILPLLPLAEAFRAQGDEVIVASGPDAADVVSRRGLPFHVVGPTFAEWFGALRARTRGMPGDGLTWAPIWAAGAHSDAHVEVLRAGPAVSRSERRPSERVPSRHD